MIIIRCLKAQILIAGFLIIAVFICTARTGAEGPYPWELHAGTGVADMTPDVYKMKIPLNGYGERHKTPAGGVHDRLCTKALAITSISPGGTREDAVIVTTDLCMVTEALREAVLGRIEPLGYNDDNLFLTATHTHSGPAAIDIRLPVEIAMGKFNPELFEFTADRIAAAVKKAAKSMVPVRADMVQGSFPNLVRNRREDKYDYATRRFVGEPSKNIDPLMSVLVVSGHNKKPVAILVVFGSHPTILGPDNLLISADWPGSLTKTLEARMPGLVAMFANGAEGDQAPPSMDAKDDFEWADKYGRAVADTAAKLAKHASPRGNLKLSSAVIRNRLPRMRLRSFLGIVIPRIFTKSIARDAIGSALVLGDAAFLGLPGEPLHRVGIELRERAKRKGVGKPVAVGLTNDWIGYLADPESYSEGGYEANMTLFGPREADLCLRTTLEALDKALKK